jgi:hypothetical protein
MTVALRWGRGFSPCRAQSLWYPLELHQPSRWNRNSRHSFDLARLSAPPDRNTIRHSSRNASGGEHGGDRICGLEATPENHTAERLRRGTLRWADDVSTGRVVPGGTIVSDAQLARGEYYRQTAEEIRWFARQSRFPEIGKEPSELAQRFDRMAAFVESRQLVDEI